MVETFSDPKSPAREISVVMSKDTEGPAYFLSVVLNGEKIEREVSVEEFCKAERSAGFRPKLPSDHPKYMTTPATGGFAGGGICGRISYAERSKP